MPTNARSARRASRGPSLAATPSLRRTVVVALAPIFVAAALPLACANGSNDPSAPAAADDAVADLGDVALFPVDDGGPVGPAPACTGGFGAATIACGSAGTLTWSCTNATTCSYDCVGTTASSGAVACSGSASVVVDTAGESCTIHATGTGGSAQAIANAACAGKPACSGSFTGCGQTSTVSWSCLGATSCTYDCTGTYVSSGAVACDGSIAIAVGAAGERCTVTGTGPGGTASGSFEATCLPPACSGSLGGCGASSTASWSCTGASACTYVCSGSIASSGPLACAGSTPLAVGDAGESCTISATGPGGDAATTIAASCP